MLMFNGCTEASYHCVVTFATSPADNSLGYESYLLSFSFLENEKFHTTESHYDSLKYILSLFDKKFNNIVAIIADNCTTNKRLCCLANMYFIKRASHRPNLAVKDVLSSHSILIEN